MTLTEILDLYKKGHLGIKLRPSYAYLDLEGQDENNEPIKARVVANQIYQVTYLSSTDGVGLFDLDNSNSVAFSLKEQYWEYTSTYSDVLH